MTLPRAAIDQLREQSVASASESQHETMRMLVSEIRRLEDALEKRDSEIESLKLANDMLRRRVISLEEDCR